VEEKGTDVADVADLVGQHRYQLDAKGRMALPVKFREAFSEGGYVTLGEDGCLYVFSRAEWNRRAEGARSRITAGRVGRDYARVFFGTAEAVELDKQGRMVIPQKLRGQIGLERDVMVVGVFDHLEVWSGPVWEQQESARLGAYMAGTLEPEG
jgi:MraZ protein